MSNSDCRGLSYHKAMSQSGFVAAYRHIRDFTDLIQLYFTLNVQSFNIEPHKSSSYFCLYWAFRWCVLLVIGLAVFSTFSFHHSPPLPAAVSFVYFFLWQIIFTCLSLSFRFSPPFGCSPPCRSVFIHYQSFSSSDYLFIYLLHIRCLSNSPPLSFVFNLAYVVSLGTLSIHIHVTLL